MYLVGVFGGDFNRILWREGERDGGPEVGFRRSFGRRSRAGLISDLFPHVGGLGAGMVVRL